ncbi:Uncoordinated protein 79 [Trichinella papuae]|uniref:Uncoordinated protein 79 n=1 Tax=Trichinella papuae TaxID=268474 RepID=A0A0V1MWK7_9BILA|nr:Uncoordinated protein 79 [Trichinella papuae]
MFKAKSVSVAVEIDRLRIMNMSLRVSAFSAKIRNLNEFYQHVTNSQQLPSGLDIVNTLRYFQQTLLGILRDVQGTSTETFLSIKSDVSRATLFPNLNYNGLYNALNNIIDIYPLVTTGQIALGNAILNTIHCVYLFLDREHAEQLPYNVASLLSIYPSELYPDVLRLLCNVLLPFTLYNESGNSYATASVSSIILLVFQYCKDPRHHTWLIETLMSLRCDVYKDIMSVIAYGTTESRIPAVNLLFHYWPLSKADFIDRKTAEYKIHAWAPTRCQQRNCNSGDENLSTKKCYDSSYCAEYGDIAPPLFLCSQCAQEVPDALRSSLFPYFQPLSTLANICQNKECTSSNRLAVSTCFSDECVRLNNFIPSRLCEQCHRQRHQNVNHTYLEAIPSAWNCEPKFFADMITAIVSLLKETSVLIEEVHAEKLPKWLQHLEGSDQSKKTLTDERRTLSAYGIKMLISFCPPIENASQDAIGHLLAALFQWFATTALLPSDCIGTSIEQLKSEFVCSWLRRIIESHYGMFVQCLLPKPPSFAKVGGAWDKLSKRSDQLKDGLSKILALIPYDLISFDTWERIMPDWFDVMSNEIPESDLPELKVLLCKIFEVDLCSLSFPSNQIYHFIQVRLQGDNFKDQESALCWLQLLTDIDIVIPMDTLLNLLKLGAKSVFSFQPVTTEGLSFKEHMNDPESSLFAEEDIMHFSNDMHHSHRQSVFSTNDSTSVVLFIVILDILMRQMELGGFNKNQGTSSVVEQNIMCVIIDIIKLPWLGMHTCSNVECDQFADCVYCRDSTIFFQLAMETIATLCPSLGRAIFESSDKMHGKQSTASRSFGESAVREETKLENSSSVDRKDGKEMESFVDSEVHNLKRRSVIAGDNVNSSGTFSTVVQEEYPEEFVGILPVEEPEVATVEAITVTDSELEQANCKVVTTTTMMDVCDSPNEISKKTESAVDDSFWYTSLGKFRFRIEDLPAELRLIHAYMTTVEDHPNPDVRYFMLTTIKCLCLNSNALKNAQFERRGFLIWAQENILIPKFWKLLRSQYSQVSEVCACLIFHCLSLPCGADVFWSTVSRDFVNSDFRTRLEAVEKVTVLSWFIDAPSVKNNVNIEGALAIAFVFLISATNDHNSTVAQRALISVQTIKESSLKCLCKSLESQFDLVIEDRALMMHQFLVLSSVLQNVPVLNWEFFQNRFEALSKEAQMQLQTTGKITFPGDYYLHDNMVEIYRHKSSLARQLADKGETLRSIQRYLINCLTELQKNIDDSLRITYAYFLKGESSSQKVESNIQTNNNIEVNLFDLSSTIKQLQKQSSFGCKSTTNASSSNEDSSGRPSTTPMDNTLRESVRLIITLFMKFLSNSRTACVNADEKASAKRQSSVLRHLNMLLGFNVQERTFTVPAHRLRQCLYISCFIYLLFFLHFNFRSSAICNSFLSNLPKVLDNNVFFVRQILPLASSLLVYLPSPPKMFALNSSVSITSDCTLWCLEPHMRQHWMWSLLLILYKYQFDQPPINEAVLNMIRIVICTLNSQVHTCVRLQMSMHSPSFRSTMFPYLKGVRSTPEESRRTRLQTSINNVRILVRTLRYWPISSRSSNESLIQSKSTQTKETLLCFTVVVTNCLGSSIAGSCESVSTEQDETSEITANISASATNKSAIQASLSSTVARKRRALPQRQLTFDEREEHHLEDMEYRENGKFDSKQTTTSKDSLNVIQKSQLLASTKHKPTVDSQIPSLDSNGDDTVSVETFKPEEQFAIAVMEPSPQPFQAVHPEFEIVAPVQRVQNEQLASAYLVQPPAVVVLPSLIENGTNNLEIAKPMEATVITEKVEPAFCYPTANVVDGDIANAKTVVHKVHSDPGSVVQGKSVSPILQQHQVAKPVFLGQMRLNDSVIQARCFHCNAILEICDEDTISLGIVCLSTFVHRDPSMAAPQLLSMLTAVSKIASHIFHPWQARTNIFVPSNCRSVARQFIRIVLHQLAPNRLFLSLFESEIEDELFFKTVALCLADFQELNPVSVIQHLMEDLHKSTPDNVVLVLSNLAEYMRHISYDTHLPTWTTVVGLFDNFFRQILTNNADLSLCVEHLFQILNRLFKISNFGTIRPSLSLLDTCCKFITRLLLDYPLNLVDVIALCSSCNRAFVKERDKHTLTRCCLNEFCQALKFKHTLHDVNYMMVIKLILYDFGETDDCSLDRMMFATSAADCARPFLPDFIEFLQDYHVLNRMKALHCMVARENGGLCEDTLGGELKIGLAKYVAHEIYRSVSRDSRSIYRFLPWLSSPPTVTQLGANEFVDCVGRVRLLSWVLLGSLSSCCSSFNMPLPIECSHRISDYIQFVLAGFAELSNQSVLNMSALFHAFHLCQLWTVYCEEAVLHALDDSVKENAMASVMDFWSRITPAILQLLSHSKVLADMVNLHFLNTVEGLLEADSVVLTKLYPMWYPILSAYHTNIPSHLMVRLDFFENSIHSSSERDLKPWLKKISFKIGQVELQSSAATQFYSV